MARKPSFDYDTMTSSFKWGDILDELDWLPGGFLNAAHEAIDRHANGRLHDKVAMLWEGRNGGRDALTFGQIKSQSDSFANVLRSLGVERGDRVFTLMDRVPELYVAFFGTLKAGAIAGPLFSALGPDHVKERLQDSGAKILVAPPELRRRISGIIPELFDLQHIVVVNRDDADSVDVADLSYNEEMSKASANFDIVPTSQYDDYILQYTSGTTGKAKGVVHRHQAIVQHYATGKLVLDLQPEDVYWCTADPGWATGTSYGILAPWTNGVTQLIYEGGFDPDAWYEIIQRHSVTVWYTAPAALRMLMKAGDDLPMRYDLSSLRHICSVGEPLSPEVTAWGEEIFGVPFRDTWWQAETGAILVANYPGMEIRPGSMGRPIPGVEIGVLDDDYEPVASMADGNLAVRPGWPSMFRTYWRNPEVYNSKFRKGWYVTGDRARMDEDGYLWFVGRADRP